MEIDHQWIQHFSLVSKCNREFSDPQRVIPSRPPNQSSIPKANIKGFYRGHPKTLYDGGIFSKYSQVGEFSPKNLEEVAKIYYTSNIYPMPTKSSFYLSDLVFLDLDLLDQDLIQCHAEFEYIIKYHITI